MDRDNNTPLHYAAKYGREEVAKKICLTSNVIDSVNNNGMSAAHFAAMNGHNAVIEILYEYGANMCGLNSASYSPLHYAIEFGFDKIANFLIEKGAIVEDENSYELLLQMAGEKRSPCFTELIKSKKPFQMLNNIGWNIIHFAAANGNNHILNSLHESITEKIIKKKDKNGRNPLIIAAINDNLDFIKLLDKYGLGYFNEKDKFDVHF